MGNKKKLIKKGLIDLFPKNIDCLIDVFAGSGIVSMNTKANNYIVNDIDKNLYTLYQLFKSKRPEDIINHIENIIEKFELAKERTSHKIFNDNRKERYKNAYYNFRKYYNEHKNIMDFYTLMFYSFSQQFRFNDKDEFNMPCGNDCFSDKNKEYIINGTNFFKKEYVKISNQDFRSMCINSITNKDYVYLDPPYFNTMATYNECDGWNENDERDLYKFCEKLSDKNIKWGMSNVFENKGVKNQSLIEWCNKNNWNIYVFDKFSYTACGKGNSNTKEVFIRNY